MGLFNEPKRGVFFLPNLKPIADSSFNVAITRAKELLVIIGNANLLQVSLHALCLIVSGN